MADDDQKEKSTVEKEKDKHGDRSGPESDSCSETGSDSSEDSDVEFECTACDKSFSGYLPYKQHLRGKKHARTASRKKEEARLKDADCDNLEEDFCLPEPFAACKVCRKEFSGPESYHAHLRSKTHKQKVVEASILQQVREGGEIDVDKLREKLYKGGSHRTGSDLNQHHQHQAATLDDQNATEFECEACEKVFSGLTPYAQHLVSKVHARRVEGRKKVEEMAGGGGGTIRLEDDDVLVCKVCTVSFSGPESAAQHLKSKNHAKHLDRYVRRLERKREKEAEKAEKRSGGEKTSDKDVQLPDPSVAKTMNALPSADEASADKTSKEPGDGKASAEKTSKEPRDEKALDKDVPKIPSDSSVLKKMEEGRTASSDDVIDETSHRYQKYKEYKKLMNSLREDDSGF